MTNYAIITAAGVGKRMQHNKNKIFMLLEEEPIITKTIAVFQNTDEIDQIILVARQDDIGELENIKQKNKFSKISKIVLGGDKRQNSVYNGLISLEDAKADDICVIHNGANPFIDKKTIVDSIQAAKKYEASVVGFKARDTIKRVNEKGFVTETLKRSELYQVQTPQTIRFGTAIRAFKKAFDEDFFGTDDVMLVERLGKKVKIIDCPYENIKITLPNDLEFANKLLNNGRIGFGQDSHRFITDGEKNLILGGITLEGKGFDANSDGDVILHALYNAIAQGLGESSISTVADQMCQNGIKNSLFYLQEILKIMNSRGYKINNIGIMLEGKTPKILPIEEDLKVSLHHITGIDKQSIGITATSGEGLSAFGKGLGMQCFCVVTLNKI